MKIAALTCMFLTINAFSDNQLASEIYDYNYIKVKSEMPKLKNLYDSKELAVHLVYINEQNSKLQEYYAKMRLMEIEEENARKYANTTLEVSFIFSDQMLDKRASIEKYSNKIFTFETWAIEFTAFVKENVREFDSDLSIKLTDFLKENKKFNNKFDSYTSFFSEASLKFNDLIETNEKLTINQRYFNLYNAFYNYLKEISETSERFTETERKQNQAVLDNNLLMTKKLSYERDLAKFKPEADELLFEMLDLKANVLFSLLKLVDTTFEVLLGDYWEIQTKDRNFEIMKRKSDIHHMKYLHDLMKRKTEEIRQYDLYVTDEDIEKLGVFKREGEQILTKMTMEKALKGQKCQEFELDSLERALIHESQQLSPSSYIYMTMIWKIFSFFGQAVESYCQIYNYTVNTIAHSSAAYLSFAMTDQFAKIVSLTHFHRFDLLKDLIKAADDPYLLKYWKLRGKIEDRSQKILAVDFKKDTGFNYFSILILLVMLVSAGIGFWAVREKEKEEEIERLNRTNSSILFD